MPAPTPEGVPIPACLRRAEEAREPATAGFSWNERHLQCIWADARLRPERLVTTGGRAVRVLDPGRWNGGPGPDFRGAKLEIGGELRTGDVEIHVRPGDWNAHGHSGDPAYADVALHVAWFPPAPGEALPDVPLALLRDPMLDRPGFSFDQIDPSAYPRPARSDLDRPCRDALADAPPAEAAALLARAGRTRLARKARALAAKAERVGSRERVFHEEVLAALGWRPNAAPMRALARALPPEELAAASDDLARYALLLGRAGLLPEEGARGLPADWIAGIWGAAFRAGASHAADAKAGWTIAGVRPANHPRVRLAAAAALFRTPDGLLRALEALPRGDAKAWARAAEKVFADAVRGAEALLPPKAAARGAPLGGERIRAMLANIVVPMLAAEDGDAWRLLEELPGEAVGAPMKEMAFRLFGGDHNPALYASRALLTQGLLELWDAYCAASPESCRTCPLAASVQRP